MEKQRLTNLALIAALAVNSACSTIKPASPESAPIKSPSTHVDPTLTPFQPPILALEATATSIPEWQKPLDERFVLGSFDPNTGFTLDSTPDLLKELKFSHPNETKEFIVEPALRVLTNFLPSDYDGGAGTKFHESGEKHGGTTPLLYLSDLPNVLAFYCHSESLKACGELIRMIGSFVRKDHDNEAKVKGKQLIFKTNDGQNITGTIVMVTSFTEAQYEDVTSDERFWGAYADRDNIIFLMTQKAGIIINDDHNYAIFITCMPKGGEDINLNPLDPHRASFNTAERAVVVVQLDN
jgi:hypothetical protein